MNNIKRLLNLGILLTLLALIIYYLIPPSVL